MCGCAQVPQAGLSAVGDAKLLATFSRNLLDGPSHAPAPFYLSIKADGLSHGLLLNTGRYSMFDLGNSSASEVRGPATATALDLSNSNHMPSGSSARTHPVFRGQLAGVHSLGAGADPLSREGDGVLPAGRSAPPRPAQRPPAARKLPRDGWPQHEPPAP